MPRGKSNQNSDILEYALSHLERERDEIQQRIDHIRRQLGGRSGTSGPAAGAPASTPAPGARKKRVLSEAARKRIAAAQKRRWAEHRKQAKASE
jgi:hypothetical protein